MSTFNLFFEEGFFHIVSLDAIDHILFILAFVAIYDFKEWKKIFWIVTSFTIAHSLSLFISLMDLVRINSALIEILIAFTISFTCIENLFVKSAPKHRIIVTGFFGLIHGLGFSNALKSLFMGMDLNLFETLLPFNIGIEIAQLLIIGIILLLFYVMYNHFKMDKKIINRLISVPTLFLSIYWMLNRADLY